jgi:hypothetical protein
MYKGVEPILVTRPKTVVLPKVKPIVTKGVHVDVKVRYSEPKLKQQNGNIVKGFPKDWSRGIHSVNIIPRPNSPCCTYCHQIGHKINECPFIEYNVKQGFG